MTAPTPCRAVYGFAWFLLFKTLFILYLLWALIPEYILEEVLGLTYLPDKYFAMLLPVLVLCALTMFAFLIYPPMNLAMQDNIDNIHTLRDKNTIRRCQHVFEMNGKRCERKVNALPPHESNQHNRWLFDKYCFDHSKLNDNNDVKMQTTKATKNSRLSLTSEDKISANDKNGYCDCVNKANCLLNTNPNHLQLLENRATVPSACDLDIADVCKQLFLEE